MRIGILDNSILNKATDIILSYPNVSQINKNNDNSVEIVVENIEQLSNQLFEDHGLCLIMNDDSSYMIGSIINEILSGTQGTEGTQTPEDIEQAVKDVDPNDISQEITNPNAKKKRDAENDVKNSVSAFIDRLDPTIRKNIEDRLNDKLKRRDSDVDDVLANIAGLNDLFN